MNLVRLGVMWEAVEVSPGVYNETLLTEVNDLITKLGKQGIYTLVDVHQDGISRTSCGEGMPVFYANEILSHDTYCISPELDWFLAPILKHFGPCKKMEEYHLRKDKNGLPLIEDCQKILYVNYMMSWDSIAIYRALFWN